jgi:hypothetical protein
VAAGLDPHQETQNLEKYSRGGLEGRLVERFRLRLVRVAASRQGHPTPPPCADRRYPGGTAFLVRAHLQRPADGLSELLRVSTGHVLVTVPHEPFFRAGNLARGRYVRRLGSTPGHLNTWGRRGIAKLVRAQAGQAEVIEMFPWLGVLARR